MKDPEAADAGRKLLQLAFAFLVMPVLGYLIGATIFNHFWDKIEPGPPKEGAAVVIAQSCERPAPVSLRGFGFWWECKAEVHSAAGIRTVTVKGFLKPEHIGKEVGVTTTRRGDIAPTKRPYQGLGGALLIPFFIVWLYVLARIANPLLEKYIPKPGQPVEQAKSTPEPGRPVERTEAVPEQPSREAQTELATDGLTITGGRKVPRWVVIVVLAHGGIGAVMYTDDIVGGDPTASSYGIVSWALLAVAAGYGAYVRNFAPSVTISPDGVAWRKGMLSWDEVQRVHVSETNTLTIQPREGELVQVGPFGDEQAEQIQGALARFSPAV